jgi:hypothetical protein
MSKIQYASPRLLPRALATLSVFALLQTSAFAATGEVFVTGSTWTGRVDGVTRYTGSSMAGAVNACVANMSSGTITIKNSGSAGGQMNIKSNITIDGTGRTISHTGSTGIVYAQNSSNVGARNINMSGNAWYGMYFRTCDTMNFSSVNGSSNLGYRIDNCKGGPGYRLSVGSITLNNGGSHAFETYGINGVSWGTITASDWTTGCGVLLNYSSGARGTAVNATRCDFAGGGYAGFRTANSNRDTVLGSVSATSTGRGYFSVSGSSGCTITTVNATNIKSHGIWLQTTSNTRVNGGTVTNAHPCTAVSSDGGGNYINVACR